MEEDQLLRIRYRKKTQQDGIHHAEDGGVGADPQRDGQHRNNCERGRLCQ